MTRRELRERHIGVLMGGFSAEREVSLRTGRAVAAALREAGYRATEVDVDRDLPERLRQEGIEVAFIALHGAFGEDGAVQGLLEMMGIPYTGSGVQASSVAMDKVTTKQLLLYHELPTPGFQVVTGPEEAKRLAADCPHFPVVVKPASEGSTIGVTVARDRKGLEAGLVEALRHDDTVLVEEFVEGMEVTVGVLEDRALPIIQVVPKGGFYDFTAKYTPGQTEYLLPAPLTPALYRKIQQVAVEAGRVLGCRGAIRVDFMVREKEFFCLEVNTIPGMTETSLLPKAAAHDGIEFGELVQRILEGAGLRR